jgi:hypothetical protein
MPVTTDVCIIREFISFKDVVGLRTLSILRGKHGVSLPHLRDVAAIRALPVPFTGFEVISPLASTARAADAFRPALADEVSATGVFVWKHCLELGNAHLMDLRWFAITVSNLMERP